MNAQSLKRRFVEGLFWVAATKALGQAIAWIISIAVVRMLSPHDYGLMGAAALFTGFLLLFNELGLGAAIVRAPDLAEDAVAQLRWALLGINLLITVTVIALAPLVAAYFVQPSLTAIIRTLSVGFVIQALGIPSGSMLHREMAFKKRARAEVIANFVGGVCTFTAAANGLAVWSLVIGYLVQQSVMSALFCIYRPVPFVPRFSISTVRSFMNFGATVASSRLLWFASSNADSLVVGRMLGSTQLGYYGLAFQLASMPIDKVVSLVTHVALPSFAILQTDVQQQRRYYLKLVSTVALVTFPVFIGMALVAEDIVSLLLTSKWLPIVVPLQILCLVSVLRGIETMNSPLLFARGKANVQMWNNLAQAIVLPIAFFIGAGWGLQGVAFAWLVVWPFLFFAVTYCTLQVLGLSFGAYLDCLRHPAAAAACMVAAVVTLRQFVGSSTPSLSRLILTCVAGALTYLAYYAVFNRQTIEDIRGAVTGRSQRTEAVAAAAPSESITPHRPAIAVDATTEPHGV